MLLTEAIKLKGDNEYYYTNDGVLGYHITDFNGKLGYGLNNVEAKRGLDLPTIGDVRMCYSGYHSAGSVATAMRYRHLDVGNLCMVRSYGIVVYNEMYGNSLGVSSTKVVSTNRCIEKVISRETSMHNLGLFKMGCLQLINRLREKAVKRISNHLGIVDICCRLENTRIYTSLYSEHSAFHVGSDTLQMLKGYWVILEHYRNIIADLYRERISESIRTVHKNGIVSTDTIANNVIDMLVGYSIIDAGSCYSIDYFSSDLDGCSFIDIIQRTLISIRDTVGVLTKDSDIYVELNSVFGDVPIEQATEILSSNMDVCCFYPQYSIGTGTEFSTKATADAIMNCTPRGDGEYFNVEGHPVKKDSFPTLLVRNDDFIGNEDKYINVLREKYEYNPFGY